MNTKRYKRKVHKVTQKSDRGNQHRQHLEGKLNVAAKRVTLLPGFLINGFTSNTAKKARDFADTKQKKPHFLNEDLQAFLEQKGKLPRRSQRLKNINSQHPTTNGSESPTSICNDNNNYIRMFSSSKQLSSSPNNNKFKSILTNSKSIFKEISERFSKVNLKNSDPQSQKIDRSVQYEMDDNSLIREDHSNDFIDHDIMLNEIHTNQDTNSDQNNVPKIEVNGSFCSDFEKQIVVTFRKYTVDECREKIRKEIITVNRVLEGRIQLQEKVNTDSDENDSSNDAENDPSSKFYPFPSQNWIYKTPPKQRIGVPQLEEPKLRAGILCQNRDQQNLYEVKPNFNMGFSNGPSDRVSIDDRFLRKVAEIKRTPAHFGFRGCDGGHESRDVFQQPWCDNKGGSYEAEEKQETFVNPNFINIISCPTKPARIPIYSDFSQNKIPTLFQQKTNNQSLEELQDFTFIEDGNDFKIQETQPSQRNKRKLSDEDYVVKRRNVFGEEVNQINNCETNNMFNFGSQDRNMFDFGKV